MNFNHKIDSICMYHWYIEIDLVTNNGKRLWFRKSVANKSISETFCNCVQWNLNRFQWIRNYCLRQSPFSKKRLISFKNDRQFSKCQLSTWSVFDWINVHAQQKQQSSPRWMQRFNRILLTLVGGGRNCSQTEFITKTKVERDTHREKKNDRDENWKWKTIKQAKRSIETLWLQILWLLLHLSVCQSILGHLKIHFGCLIFPHRIKSFDHNIGDGFRIES